MQWWVGPVHSYSVLNMQSSIEGGWGGGGGGGGGGGEVYVRQLLCLPLYFTMLQFVQNTAKDWNLGRHTYWL